MITRHAAVVNNAAVATHLTISCVKSQRPRPVSPSIRSTIVLHKSAFVYAVFERCAQFFGAASGNGPTVNADDIATDGGQIARGLALRKNSDVSLTIRLLLWTDFK